MYLEEILPVDKDEYVLREYFRLLEETELSEDDKLYIQHIVSNEQFAYI